MNRTSYQKRQTSKEYGNSYGNTSFARLEAIHKRIGQCWRSIWRCIARRKTKPTLDELLSMSGEPEITSQELTGAIRVLVKLSRLVENKSNEALLLHGLLRNEPAELVTKDTIERLKAIVLVIQTLAFWDAIQKRIASKDKKNGLN